MKRYHGTLKWASFQSATSTLGLVDSRCGVRRRGGEKGVKKREKRFVCCGSSLSCSIFLIGGRQARSSIMSLHTEPPRKRRLGVYALDNSINQVCFCLYFFSSNAVPFAINNVRLPTRLRGSINLDQNAEHRRFAACTQDCP